MPMWEMPNTMITEQDKQDIQKMIQSAIEEARRNFNLELESLKKDIKSDTYTNLEVYNKPVQFNKSIRFNYLTPAQITANQNDYGNPNTTPGTVGDACVLRLSTDASRNITGFKYGSLGRILIIINVGSFNIVLTDEDTLSVAANRMALHGSLNLTLNSEDSVMLWYDTVSARWRDIFN